MASERTRPEKKSMKKHGDALDHAAMKDADRHAAGKRADAVPMPDAGAHERSHAAHLGGKVHEQTKAADKLREGMSSSTLREPPMVMSRIGKQHRG